MADSDPSADIPVQKRRDRKALILAALMAAVLVALMWWAGS
jgi:ferric-dicitrate binding protein FerR (iron transport regulator)